MPSIVVGTAGHIDHGKSALVKALTGTDPDRLKEEKERGITIDIGFASLRLDAETTVGLVDVPGHERFIKNMLAGAGGIDAVMLVVAADESVMPQTREHLDICSLLHVQHGFIVLTKIDAADPELADLADVEARELVRGTFLEGAPVVRASARTGEGMDAVVAALRDVAARVRPKDASRLFRLPIDRAFTMKGFGTVVSGTLVSGRIRRDEDVELLPARQAARVRGIHVHGAAVEEAHAGQRTALNLQRIELADVSRGMVLATPGAFAPSRTFDVRLELLRSSPPLVRRKRIRFHVGTAEVMGHAVLLGQERLDPGGRAVAQIRLDEPTFALPGDRFIIRQYSPMVTLGGGEIVDGQARKHRRSDLAARDGIEQLADAPVTNRALAIVRDAGLAAASAADIVARLGLRPEEAADVLTRLAAAGDVRQIADAPLTVVAADVLGTAEAALVAEVTRFHQAEPLQRGIGREELKGRVLRTAHPSAFRAALDALVAARRLALDHELVHLFGRTVTLAEPDARARTQIEERFAALGLQAGAPDDIVSALGIDRQVGRRIVRLLIDERVLVKINEELTVNAEALRRLIEQIRAMKAERSRFGVKEFKELTGLSRKFAVPLLEHLDGQRVTRRVGDERIIL